MNYPGNYGYEHHFSLQIISSIDAYTLCVIKNRRVELWAIRHADKSNCQRKAITAGESKVVTAESR